MLPRRQFLLTQLGLGASWTLCAAQVVAQSGDIVVPIVSSKSSLRDVSLASLERIFLGHSIDGADGERFVPFNHPPNTKARILFDRRVLKMDPDDVARHWVDQRIRGANKPPRSVPKVSLLKEVVHSFPGAISYLSISDLDDSVRPLTVNGIPHEARNYPIR